MKHKWFEQPAEWSVEGKTTTEKFLLTFLLAEISRWINLFHPANVISPTHEHRARANFSLKSFQNRTKNGDQMMIEKLAICVLELEMLTRCMYKSIIRLHYWMST